jgi:opacity protein-like surface antigen
MRHQTWLFALLTALAAVDAAAQTPSWTPELSVSAGIGHVFRWEDQTYGDEPSAGGAVGLVHVSGWAFEIHGDKTFGLSARQIRCGVVNVTCIGSAREGPTAMATLSIGARYQFSGRHIQPYLLGGLGMMWSRSLHSLTQVRGPIAIISESASSDRGFGPDLGGGLRIPLTGSWSLHAELRWLDASWLSRQNLAVTRVMARVTYAVR